MTRLGQPVPFRERGTGAMWRAARAAVRRRKLQTVVIGLVLLFSAATTVMALGLLVASTAPFDDAFARQRGAHVVATYDSGLVTGAQLEQTARRPGVEAVAGPFAQAVLEVTLTGPGMMGGPLNVVGRADPAGPVDRVELWAGRWPSAPGEIVLNDTPPPADLAGFGPEPGQPPILGSTAEVPGGPTLTVVGMAYSLGRTADAWVTPEQVRAFRPSSVQMLYRFASAATDQQVEAGMATVTEGLPAEALLAAQSYLLIKQSVAAEPGVFVPFLMVFGILGLVAAVLIVANVVSGAVVSGFRHIGILKALGFTPGQVLAVYLVMVSVPAVVGCAIGTVLGNIGARPLLDMSFQGMGFGPVGISPLVNVATLLGMPVVVVLAALVPASRARRLSAVEAISAGSAPRVGRGLRVQRWLGGTRLPRAVSLGLGLPFARPGRTALTMSAVLLGVTTVTFATGLTSTVTRYADATDGNDHVGVRAADPAPGAGRPASSLTDQQIEALLRALPGTNRVTVNLTLDFALVGSTRPVGVNFLRGDVETQGYREQLVEGRWLAGPDELVAPSEWLGERGLAVGDRIVLEAEGRRSPATIVGETMSGPPGPSRLLADWSALARLAPAREVGNHEILYQIQLAPGTDVPAYTAAVQAADPGLDVWDNGGTDSFTVAAVSLAAAVTLMLGLVTALAVFNTVVLNTRERRRDIGMLKSIGMTPRQVTAMMVTSMAVLGMLGGLLGIPVGIVAHRLVVPIASGAAQIRVPDSLINVWEAPLLGVLALAGAVIAMVGALLPARSAARLPIAEVLHNE
ncbi:FtsX-like permease family protein [Plantactinospora sp. B6F1]|uniref:ABC transporter permease n=1 Tax=Plantactinospora sp. B6F1 TaxID=3158971 RepID=UPI0032D8C571